jgi:hypothetical protein
MSLQINLLHDYYLQYYVIGIINGKLRLILIDTGASMSHISYQYVTPDQLKPIEKPHEIEGYIDHECNIGIKHRVNYTTNISVIFSKSFTKIIQLEVVQSISNDKLGADILFGMDFLDSFETYSITKEQLILKEGNITHYIPRITVDTETIKQTLGY